MLIQEELQAFEKASVWQSDSSSKVDNNDSNPLILTIPTTKFEGGFEK
jgi:hypothetical protein